MTAAVTQGIATKGFATHGPEAKFESFEFARREVGPNDILIDLHYCGICHSDIHLARDEWNAFFPAMYPMVPGHEIVGRVAQIGDSVSKFKAGDAAGIGCFVDSCRKCAACSDGIEQYCIKGAAYTYGGTEMDRATPTFGGYSNKYVIDERYAHTINAAGDLAGFAPLLCAGITTYSPLKKFNVGPGQKVGVVGLGGLGHMGVKIANAMSADVTVFSTSPGKEADARRLGAKDFVVTKDPANLEPLAGQYNLILDTVSADHDINPYFGCLGVGGVLAIVGLPNLPATVHHAAVIMGNKSLAGSLIGGIPETQEMLDFCADHNITADVEVITPDRIEEAYDRTVKSDVRYRFVIDMQRA
ncbi:MAG: NAD(P)-dependent alcohol dehydrogenase [Acidobacteria bacterium]|nr:NAD(P)-dependent alcohol dehydrogenase [Acidobacteriota bacterium]MCA1608645.1 NAD(P)-dependent alcohol dehydrogenase [Acidobacteriota bacterium]